MRIADPHLIYHTDSKKRINPTKSIYLGDHVWIGQSAMILKGTQIHSGSIIGALSVVSGKEIPSNTSWAGNPSRKIAENIFWTDKCVHSWIDNQTAENNVCKTDAYTYHYDPKEFIAFSQIDQKLTDASNSEERYAYLTTFTTHKAKNRFTAENQKKSSTKYFCKLSKLFK